MELPFSDQSGAPRKAYRDGAYLVLEMGSSLPDFCVLCGNPASGNLIHKVFPHRDRWWFWTLLPPALDFAAFASSLVLGTRYAFDFPFCRNCASARVHFARFRPTRLDEQLAVFRGASELILNLLPPMPPDVAVERSRGWLQRKFSWLRDNL